jgi:tetratricopeptide (TPR) repeat protein
MTIAELHLNGAEHAFEKAQALRGEFSASVSFEARATEIARRLGDEGTLATARDRLAQFDLDKLTPIELFDAYADDGQYGKAADLLGGLHELDRPSIILKRRLFALYRAERRGDARALYESLTGKVLESIELLRLGAAIYERSGLLPKSLAALDRAIALDSSDLRSRLDWCRLSLRCAEETRVSKWIKKADRTGRRAGGHSRVRAASAPLRPSP